MQIPQPIEGFDTPTLIVILDRLNAEFYLGSDRQFECVGYLKTSPLDFENTGGERKTLLRNTGTGVVDAVADEDMNKIYRKRFFKSVSEELWTRFQAKEFECMILVTSKGYEREFMDLLRQELAASVTKVVSALLTKRSLPEIVERIQGENVWSGESIK